MTQTDERERERMKRGRMKRRKEDTRQFKVICMI